MEIDRLRQQTSSIYGYPIPAAFSLQLLFPENVPVFQLCFHSAPRFRIGLNSIGIAIAPSTSIRRDLREFSGILEFTSTTLNAIILRVLKINAKFLPIYILHSRGATYLLLRQCQKLFYTCNTFTGHILSCARLETPAMLFIGSAAYFKTRQLSIKL